MHGRVLRISPIEDGKGAPYFEAQLCDGEWQIRLVRFKRSQRDLPSDFEGSSNSVVLENCQVKKARLSEELEVLLYTGIPNNGQKICDSDYVFNTRLTAFTVDW